MARRAAYKKRRQNKTGIFLVTLVLLMMLVVVGIKSIELREKKAYYAKREEELALQIEQEEQRKSKSTRPTRRPRSTLKRLPVISSDWYMKVRSFLRMRIR